MAARRTAGGWYLVGIGLIGSAIAIAVTGFAQMASTVEGMRRVEMPGRAELILSGGLSTIYFEPRSSIDGRALDAPEDLRFSCTLEDANHRSIELRPPRATVTYSFGDYTGRSVFDFEAPPGTLALACTGPSKFAVAVGGGIGAWIIVAIVGGLVPGLGGLAMIIVVFVKRRSAVRHRP